MFTPLPMAVVQGWMPEAIGQSGKEQRTASSALTAQRGNTACIYMQE